MQLNFIANHDEQQNTQSDCLTHHAHCRGCDHCRLICTLLIFVDWHGRHRPYAGRGDVRHGTDAQTVGLQTGADASEGDVDRRVGSIHHHAPCGLAALPAAQPATRIGFRRDPCGLLSRRNGQQCDLLFSQGRRCAERCHDGCLHPIGSVCDTRIGSAFGRRDGGCGCFGNVHKHCSGGDTANRGGARRQPLFREFHAESHPLHAYALHPGHRRDHRDHRLTQRTKHHGM